MRNVLATIFLFILLLGSLAYGDTPTSQPSQPTMTQVERIAEAMQANYDAHEAYRKEDWKTAVEKSDKCARLLRDIWYYENERNAENSASVADAK